MAAQTFPAIVPDKGATLSTRPRVLKAKFGDGYQQKAGEGINQLEHTYRASFRERPKAEIAQMKAFLDTHGGYTPFNFTIPGEAAPRSWCCESWPITSNSPTLSSMNVVFVEDFSA